ncbi:MAG TPA: thioesterase family protein, partial [Planctomycetota bacterium]|nr:thioesterase family protein [Planctomycetota bacterium]
METPQVPPSERVRFSARSHTRWSDEDNQAVLNNAVYLTLFEEARHAYFGSLGLLEANRFPFLLAACNVRFLRPGRGGVEVAIETITLHLGTTSFRQGYRVRCDDEVWAEAEALMVCYDPATNAPAPMTPAFRAAVAAFEDL